MSPAEAPSLETLWGELEPHIEWPEGFALSLLFANHPTPVRELRRRVQLSAQERGGEVRVFEPEDTDEFDAVASELVRPASEVSYRVQWVSLIRRAGSPGWTDAVRGVLRRLNERRFLLERDAPIPLVLVLPEDVRSHVYVDASDLWTVRSFVGAVPSPQPGPINIADRSRAARPRESTGPEPKRSLAEREWARLLSVEAPQGLDPADGFAAFESVARRGDLKTTRRIAMQALSVALAAAGVEVVSRERFDVVTALAEVTDPGVRERRDLSIAIEYLGHVEVRAGNAVAARALFESSLEIRKKVAESDSDSPQALRDLSIAYNSLGSLELDAGNLASARTYLQRSLETCEELANSHPASSQALRDLSVAYKSLGKLELSAGNLSPARTYLQRSLDRCEELVRSLPPSLPASPQALRDLSIAYNALGQLELDAGNLAAARTLLQRSLDTDYKVASAVPRNAQALRNLSIAYNSLGKLEVYAGNLATARTLFKRDLEVATILSESDPHNAEAAFDLVCTLRSLASAELDPEVEGQLRKRAHALMLAMDAEGHVKGYAKREAALKQLGRDLVD